MESMVVIHKKGDLALCKNCREILLPLTAGKILNIV